MEVMNGIQLISWVPVHQAGDFSISEVTFAILQRRYKKYLGSNQCRLAHFCRPVNMQLKENYGATLFAHNIYFVLQQPKTQHIVGQILILLWKSTQLANSSLDTGSHAYPFIRLFLESALKERRGESLRGDDR